MVSRGTFSDSKWCRKLTGKAWLPRFDVQSLQRKFICSTRNTYSGEWGQSIDVIINCIYWDHWRVDTNNLSHRQKTHPGFLLKSIHCCTNNKNIDVNSRFSINGWVLFAFTLLMSGPTLLWVLYNMDKYHTSPASDFTKLYLFYFPILYSNYPDHSILLAFGRENNSCQWENNEKQTVRL